MDVGDVAAASAAERSPSSAAFMAADSTAKFMFAFNDCCFFLCSTVSRLVMIPGTYPWVLKSLKWKNQTHYIWKIIYLLI